jgi:hypothetical protein
LTNRQQHPQQQKYYTSNMMDKQILCSTSGAVGHMHRLYHLGLLEISSNKERLHLAPVNSILQMKPSFEYLDLSEKKAKDSLQEKNEAATGNLGLLK